MTIPSLATTLEALEARLVGPLRDDPASRPALAPWLGILAIHGRTTVGCPDLADAMDASARMLLDELDQASAGGGESLGMAIAAAQGLALLVQAAATGMPPATIDLVYEMCEAAREAPLDTGAVEHLMAYADLYHLHGRPGVWPCVTEPITAGAASLVDLPTLTRNVRLPLASGQDEVLASLTASQDLAHAAGSGALSQRLRDRVNSRALPVELQAGCLPVTLQRSLREPWQIIVAISGAAVEQVRCGWRPFQYDAEDEVWRLPLEHLPADDRFASLRQPIVVTGLNLEHGTWRLELH